MMRALRSWVRENPQLPVWLCALFAGQGVIFRNAWSQLGLDIAIAIFTLVAVLLDEEPGYGTKIKSALTGLAAIAIFGLIAVREYVAWMHTDYAVFAAMLALAALIYLLVGDFTRGMTS